MKRIKLFENFKNLNDLKEDIEDIFIYFIDNDLISIKLNERKLSFSLNKVEFTKREKWGAEYNAILDKEIINELLYSINKLEIFNLKITYAKVEWVNSRECTKMPENKDKRGIGPGILTKYFTENGLKDVNIEVVQKETYHTDLISEFIKEKGDRLRHVKLYIDFI